MILLPHIVPHPALRPYVDHYFLLHINFKDVPYEQRIRPIPPDADQSLYFYPRDKVKAITHRTNEWRLSTSSIFVGQQTSRVNIQFGEDHLVIQVCFRPGFIYQLIGKMPVIDFQHQEIDAEMLSDADIRIVNEQLQETADPTAMIALIEAYLLKRVAKIKMDILPIDRAIDALKNSTTLRSLDWLADQACLSARQFERKFLQRMGMSPRFYSRITRFDRAFKMKLRQPELDWLDIAYQCGYFDFSHLLRDFRQFAEVTPSMMIMENNRSPENRYLDYEAVVYRS